ncbi:uncharacterized protein LOC112101545 [Citrus clementina]|uniref:uncharacterized protein LOC112101545 n=1 Tax=Citrus clementina TaxID=85681 RepID=UPI000CED4DA1|nr:uncharacterized protein LOC112101545 [Citrus x clementina]
MSKGKKKVIEVDDDELDFLPSLLADPTFDPGIPLEPIRPSIGTSARRNSPEATTLNSDDDGSSGSEDTLSEDPGGNSGKVSSPEVSRPKKKRKIGGRALSEHYAIDLMTCMTTVEDLVELQAEYDIPDDIPLRISGKKDTPSRLLRGYVTLFLESFKFGMRLPLQPYFVQMLRGLHLAPGQLNPNGWRVLSGLFILWSRCCQKEPMVKEVKHLYQLKSSPKNASWYYFISNTKTRKLITDLPTGGGGNWKRKSFFAGGLGQVAQIDGENIRVPSRFVVPGCLLVLDVLELLTTYNFFESRLVPTNLEMEDIVIGALTRKCRRPGVAKRDHNKEAPPGKRVNTAEQASPLKTLPHPPPARAGETSGSGDDPTSPRPPAGLRPLLPGNRPEHLVLTSASFLGS